MHMEVLGKGLYKSLEAARKCLAGIPDPAAYLQGSSSNLPVPTTEHLFTRFTETELRSFGLAPPAAFGGMEQIQPAGAALLDASTTAGQGTQQYHEMQCMLTIL